MTYIILIKWMLFCMQITNLSFFCITAGVTSSSVTTNVADHGAIGDGVADDSLAFLRSWNFICQSPSEIAALVIPENGTFLLKPVTFTGPCKPGYVHLQVSGNIVAPQNKSGYSGYRTNSWLTFSYVDGLTIYGAGVIDGKGAAWWSKACLHVKSGACRARTALTFYRCNNLALSGLTHINSQRNHMTLTSCHGVIIADLRIMAPETSPNTDGIDIASSSNVHIQGCYIGTGDDCIAISSGSSKITISGVSCGPGHGISIGALGVKGSNDTVEGVYVTDCTLTGTTAGVRIKSWQGGIGYARRIIFEKIRFVAVKNPIIIDQFYCPHRVCQNKTTAIQVSDVSYRLISGTSITDKVINLRCNQNFGCNNIVLDQVYITSILPGKEAYSYCYNAHGIATHTQPIVKFSSAIYGFS